MIARKSKMLYCSILHYTVSHELCVRRTMVSQKYRYCVTYSKTATNAMTDDGCNAFFIEKQIFDVEPLGPSVKTQNVSTVVNVDLSSFFLFLEKPSSQPWKNIGFPLRRRSVTVRPKFTRLPVDARGNEMSLVVRVTSITWISGYYCCSTIGNRPECN